MVTNQSKSIEQQSGNPERAVESTNVEVLSPQEQNNQVPTPERGVVIEGAKELEGVRIEEQGSVAEAVESVTKKLRKPKKKKLEEVTIVRDELTKEVEHIMEEGLRDAFAELSPAEAQAFKIKGEETAREIRGLLKSTRVKIKKIFRLLFDWLKMLPGINSFFLEQEAKIKADKIMALHRKQMHHRKLNITK